MKNMILHSIKIQLAKLLRSTRGVAAVELAFLAPLLLLLAFGSLDIVRALRDYNVVSKSLRDSSRFLSRVPIDCTQAAGSRISNALQTTAKQMALTGQVGVTPANAVDRLVDYWSDENSVTIQVNCISNTAADNLCGATGGNTACRGASSIPVVQVTADFAYVGMGLSLLELANIRLTASHSEMGISE